MASPSHEAGKTPRLMFLVTEDWYFWAHRLPQARAARDAGFAVSVATRVDAHGDLIRGEGFTLHPLNWRRGSINPLAGMASIGEVTRLYRREFDRRAAHLGLTRVQWRALRRIERFEGLTQIKLAEDLELAPIAVGRVLDRLEKARFIERRPDPADRRCWRLHLAPGSARVRADVDRSANDLREEVFAGIAKADLQFTERVRATLKSRFGFQQKPSPLIADD